MLVNNKKWLTIVMGAALTGVTLVASAMPNVGLDGKLRKVLPDNLRTTAGKCKPATATIDMDVNNIRARLMTGGDMWWDQGVGEARYEVPKGSKKNSLFAGSAWIGGMDPQGNLKVAAQTYRQDGNDYWPGPLEAGSKGGDGYTTTASTCSEWDRFWKINKSDLIVFRDLISKGQQATVQLDPTYQSIFEWPAKGNQTSYGNSGAPLAELQNGRDFAPFIDADKDGIYDATKGDYPDIFGDQYIWWVFNDEGNLKQQSGTDAIGMEVQTSAFAFSSNDNLNNMTFYNYRMINRSPSTLDTAFIATWTDADLGYAFDDYIGCDTNRGLGILYNGTTFDGSGQPNSYGAQIPMVGVDFFIGPKKYYTDKVTGKDTFTKLKMTAFTYFNNDASVIGNPTNGQQIYGYMTGTNRGGQRFSYDWDGVSADGSSRGYGKGPVIPFVFAGDPANKSEWSECSCNNPVGDRRFIHSSGPFKLVAGSALSQNDVTIGVVWVADVGGCPNTSFKKIRVADDQCQGLFDNNFQTIEGPEAPRVVLREMDRKFIFYLINDSISTNFQEAFGTNLSDQRYRVSTPKMKAAKAGDSLYKFEGYRVFQLKNSQVTTAQIFNADGTINSDVAAEVFQCDIRNGVGRVTNYINDRDISDTTWVPQIKVEGKDSGIKHSFSLQFDAFATGKDKRFVNYRNYYFVAIAYAYNNFRNFSNRDPDSTQDQPYLESSHAAGGKAIPVVIGMPNPANGDMGTTINADYGDGVIIKKIEGIGNGGNAISMDAASEEAALAAPNYQIYQPVYLAGQGPVNVKVVDPRKVKPGSWELFIRGRNYPSPDSTKGIMDTDGSWELQYTAPGTNTPISIYSESHLNIYNEQILENYGLSVGIVQAKRPGDDQPGGNGYISSDVTFTEPGKVWLSGVHDEEQESVQNWIRSGGNNDTLQACDYRDYKLDTAGQFYESMIPNNTLLKATWAPAGLATGENKVSCGGFGVIPKGYTNSNSMYTLHSVDIVFTSDKSKWTKSVVLEMAPDPNLAENGGKQYFPRRHKSWTGNVDANGAPVYSTVAGDTGMSWFPGYAIDQETGMRLNIMFGEDSWFKKENGADMIWNPTSALQNDAGNVINGGKHYIYVLTSKYDECAVFKKILEKPGALNFSALYTAQLQWVGLPLLNQGFSLLSLNDGLIPTETRLRFRVSRPYDAYMADPTQIARNGMKPLYSFKTDALAPVALVDNQQISRDSLRDLINIVPNPYYGYAGYEINRLDTRVRITNLPKRATVNIYSLDGTLIRRLEKDNANVSYIDWDLRNAASLPVASGMYMVHVNAVGIGETVLRWFGAMRPVDVTTY
ncbi:hypothetical protein ACTHGU_17480 [Chitinophagaceae bacterium MMS25-I14]